MTVLEPKLTPLDEKVLDALPFDRPGIRQRALVSALRRPRLWPNDRERAEQRQFERDVRLILRGFEHLGKAQCRGGWWRRTG